MSVQMSHFPVLKQSSVTVTSALRLFCVPLIKEVPGMKLNIILRTETLPVVVPETDWLIYAQKKWQSHVPGAAEVSEGVALEGGLKKRSAFLLCETAILNNHS